ncbi:hypothetical protein ACH5RR_039875 [Cinchona calisaya]|uniref:Pectinesterase inhibitor domain-containing protein n=1 Tax=Cinchona calisaya TaxID=153742 RepID=A0ABD2Y2W6_9GENT
MRKAILFFLVSLITFLVSTRTHAEPSNNNNIKVSKSLIADICKTTLNPPFCAQVLNSKPPGTSLKELAEFSIKLAEIHAKKTHDDLIVKLLEKERNPRLKDVYESCKENYEDSIDSLNDGKKALNSGDFGGLNNFASAAETDADTCQEGFEEGSFAEPPQVKQANKKLEDLSSIILSISNKL